MCAYDINNRYYESDIERLGYDNRITNGVMSGEFVSVDNYLFDCNGRLIKEFDYSIDNCCILTNEPFDNGVAFVVDDQKKEYGERKYALTNFKGQLITEFYDDVDEGWINDTYIAVEKNKKWAIIDKFGRQKTDFIFDWRGWDYEWLNLSTVYEILRIDIENDEFKLGLFTFTGILALDPIYKYIEINAEFKWFESNDDRVSALINDEIFATDFNGNKFRWTHHQGLEKIN